MTGYGLLLDTMRTAPQCNEAIDCEVDCCTSPWIAAMFFVTFVMFTKLVLLNVVVAILMVQVTTKHHSSLHHVLSCKYTSLTTPSLVACDGDLVTDD